MSIQTRKFNIQVVLHTLKSLRELPVPPVLAVPIPHRPMLQRFFIDQSMAHGRRAYSGPQWAAGTPKRRGRNWRSKVWIHGIPVDRVRLWCIFQKKTQDRNGESPLHMRWIWKTWLQLRPSRWATLLPTVQGSNSLVWCIISAAHILACTIYILHLARYNPIYMYD